MIRTAVEIAVIVAVVAGASVIAAGAAIGGIAFLAQKLVPARYWAWWNRRPLPGPRHARRK